RVVATCAGRLDPEAEFAYPGFVDQVTEPALTEQRPMPPPLRYLRLTALLGTCAVLLQEAVSAFPLQPRQAWGFVILVLAVSAVALTLRWLMPAALGKLLAHPDLLVPLGLLVFLEGVLGWLLLLQPVAALLAPSWPLKLWVLS